MKYRRLGKYGLKVSCIGLGGWLNLGGRVGTEDSIRIIRKAYEKGVNYFDTADVYGGDSDTISKHGHGENEKLLGEALEGLDRTSYVLLTKVNGPVGPGPNDRGLSTKHIYESCHASLKRLRTDYVDIYMCHRPDLETPMEETVRVMDNLHRQGKILYWGVSQHTPAQMMELIKISEQSGAAPLAACEPRYNMLFREPEHELFPLTAKYGIGNLAFSPLAHGVLTGKYAPGQPPPPGTRAADEFLNQFMKMLYWKDEYLTAAQGLKKIAGDLGIKLSQLAISWVLRRPEITSAILGVKTIEQLDEDVAAADVRLSEDGLARIEQLLPLQEHYARARGDFGRK